jgi:hypothetical protein
MKYILIFLLFICIGSRSYSQVPTQCKDTCGYYFESISYFWKLDSLGTNGYRLQVYRCLATCNKGKITEEVLLQKLGKPNETHRDNKGTIYYIYYFFDGKSIPKEADLARTRMFIFFRFDKGSPYLAAVGDDHYD